MPQLTWLVTGCSSGFGEQLVHSVLAKGDHVIATARQGHERLQHLKDVGAAILDLDVTAPQAELDEKVEEALNVYSGIDILVNNAGYIEAAIIEELEYIRPLSRAKLVTQANTCFLTATPGYARGLRRTSLALSNSLGPSCPIFEKNARVPSCS